MDSIVREAVLAHQEGRYDEALRIVGKVLEQIDDGPLPLAINYFMTMVV